MVVPALQIIATNVKVSLSGCNKKIKHATAHILQYQAVDYNWIIVLMTWYLSWLLFHFFNIETME